jgi:virulence factor Mce-like protein
MRKFRTVVNLVAFFAITAALVVYGLVDLLGNPLQSPTLVSATFPNASGVEPNFGVVLDGVVVGSVQNIQLVGRGARVVIAIRPGMSVPADVKAEIGLANDLGEQQVELVPDHKGPAPQIRSGAVIPAVPNGIPTAVGKVIGTTTRLLGAIGARQLNTVLATLAAALNGRAGDLQSMLVSSQQFSSEFLAYQRQFEALLASSPPIMNALASDSAGLHEALANTKVLADVLERHRYSLVGMIDHGASAADVLTRLLTAVRPNTACILHDFADLSSNMAQPGNLANLSVGLATNTWFFGAIAAVSPTGPSKSLFSGDPYESDQEWLRTRLFIPPGQPPANEYANPIPLPPSKPGAACDTEFGRGVPAANQLESQFYVAGGMRTDRPSSSEAQVRGGGDSSASSSNSTSLSSYSAPASSPPAGAGAWLALGVAVLLGLSLLAPRRRKWAGRGNDRSSRWTPLLARATTRRRRGL